MQHLTCHTSCRAPSQVPEVPCCSPTSHPWGGTPDNTSWFWTSLPHLWATSGLSLSRHHTAAQEASQRLRPCLVTPKNSLTTQQLQSPTNAPTHNLFSCPQNPPPDCQHLCGTDPPNILQPTSPPHSPHSSTPQAPHSL